MNAAKGGLPHVDVLEVPRNCIIRHRSHPRSTPHVIDTQSDDKTASSKAYDGILPKSSCDSYSLSRASISAAYIHVRIKRESNTRLYPLGTRGTKHEIIRAVRKGIEVHQRLYEIGGFTCIVSPLNILSSKSGDFLFVDVENTHIVTPTGLREHWKINFDHTPFSVPFLSPQLMERIETLKIKDDTPEETNNACRSASEGGEESLEGEEPDGDKRKPKVAKKKKQNCKDRTPLVVYEIESFFWILVWALTITGEKSRWRCAELMYNPSFQDSFDQLFMNDHERLWSPDPKIEVLVHPFCLPPMLRNLALRWKMQAMDDIEPPDAWMWMTIGWNVVLENLLKEFLFIRRHTLLEGELTNPHHGILSTLDRALKKMPKGNMPARCEVKSH